MDWDFLFYGYVNMLMVLLVINMPVPSVITVGLHDQVIYFKLACCVRKWTDVMM
jgi:hypothetical protein